MPSTKPAWTLNSLDGRYIIYSPVQILYHTLVFYGQPPAVVYFNKNATDQQVQAVA